jgi:hypothetical protein
VRPRDKVNITLASSPLLRRIGLVKDREGKKRERVTRL